MIDARIEVSGLDALAAAFQRAPDIAADEMVTAVLEASLLLEREVKERTPTAGGTTRESIAAQEPRILADRVVGEVASPLPHIAAVELGTRPHRPPVQPLADWAKLKFGADDAEATRIGHAVAAKIAARGTEGAFMFRDGLAANEAQVRDIVARGAARAAGRLAGTAADLDGAGA